jgi:hypothetical protein
MQITVTNTSAPLTSLLSASDLALAETNRGGNNEYEILAQTLSITLLAKQLQQAKEYLCLHQQGQQVQETLFLFLQAI